MCGIVGVCNLNGEPVAECLLRRMTNAIAHRGPDGEGHYTDGQVGLGHRRLAIIDLTTAAHQPMANETGKVLLTYNGEIYNFQKLRVELEALGHRFHSSTDSEVVVHGWEEWGEECLLRFNGMFAFAIWDRTQRRLFLARDRYGVKPLYWYLRDGLFLFGSEIKALLVHPRVSVNVCRLTLDLMKGGDATVRRYWDFPVPDEGLDVDDEEAGRRIHHLFQEAVTRQLVSDVPIGGYLSGGMDSGSIVAVAV